MRVRWYEGKWETVSERERVREREKVWEIGKEREKYFMHTVLVYSIHDRVKEIVYIWLLFKINRLKYINNSIDERKKLLSAFELVKNFF